VKSRLVRGMSFSGIRNVNDFAPTADPNVIRITRIVADDVTLTVSPAMVETAVVVANSKNLSVEMKERARRDANSKLNMFRLALMKPR
jgi:phage head maturation protease